MRTPDNSAGIHAGIVEDEAIAGIEEIRQMADDAVGQLRFATRPHDEHARGVTRSHGPERNSLFRQIEIKLVNAHAGLVVRWINWASGQPSSRCHPG